MIPLYRMVGHPFRRRTCGCYEFIASEERRPPINKTSTIVHIAAKRALEGNYKHYLGQKGLPMFVSLDNYNYNAMNIMDWMHNLARCVK